MTAKKPHRHLYRFLCVLLAFFLLLLGCDIFLLVENDLAEVRARTLPSYPMQPLTDVLGKDVFTEEDYDFLYRQTGLSRIAVSEFEHTMSKDDLSKTLSEFQAALFFEGERGHTVVVEGVCYHDVVLTKEGEPFSAPTVARKPGDVLVTSSTHTIGWAHGHAAIMLKNGDMLQSAAMGYPSQKLAQSNSVAGLCYFNESANFIVLRLKDEVAETLKGAFGIPQDASCDDVRAAISDLAAERLVGIDYSLTVGVLSPKDQGERPTGTQCAHLVWQAFRYFGLDIDSDGGLVVTPRDIARSGLFDVVQVYGFDPLTLW